MTRFFSPNLYGVTLRACESLFVLEDQEIMREVLPYLQSRGNQE